jgi:hypothetical protein
MHMILVGDAPQPLTASEVVAPRSAAAVEAQTAPTEVRRPSHARRGFAISWIAATLVTLSGLPAAAAQGDAQEDYPRRCLTLEIG